MCTIQYSSDGSDNYEFHSYELSRVDITIMSTMCREMMDELCIWHSIFLIYQLMQIMSSPDIKTLST